MVRDKLGTGHALLAPRQRHARLLGQLQHRRRRVLADAGARPRGRPRARAVAGLGPVVGCCCRCWARRLISQPDQPAAGAPDRGRARDRAKASARAAAGKGPAGDPRGQPQLQPDGRGPAAARKGPRRDPGRHLARPAHAARAHAAGSRDGAAWRRRRAKACSPTSRQMDAIIGQFLDYARPTESGELQRRSTCPSCWPTARARPAAMPDVRTTADIEPDIARAGQRDRPAARGQQPDRERAPLRQDARAPDVTEIDIDCQRANGTARARGRDQRPRRRRAGRPDRSNCCGPSPAWTARAARPTAPGLGLAIVERTVKRHRGKLLLHNRQGGGLADGDHATNNDSPEWTVARHERQRSFETRSPLTGQGQKGLRTPTA